MKDAKERSGKRMAECFDEFAEMYSSEIKKWRITVIEKLKNSIKFSHRPTPRAQSYNAGEDWAKILVLVWRKNTGFTVGLCGEAEKGGSIAKPGNLAVGKRVRKGNTQRVAQRLRCAIQRWRKRGGGGGFRGSGKTRFHQNPLPGSLAVDSKSVGNTSGEERRSGSPGGGTYATG